VTPTKLDYARAYIGRGWAAFPCNRDKSPRTDNGFEDASTDAEQITQWWTDWPDANIGLRTGVMFDVLDVDAHHDGWHSLAYAVAEYGCLASSPVTSTPQGGAHFLYLPTGLRNRTNFFPGHPGLDWRGQRGYIVAPPSIGDAEPLSPARRWVAYGWSVKPSEQTLEPAPSWLVELVTQKVKPRRASVPAASRTRPPGRCAAYGATALNEERKLVAAAAEGTRNDTLNKATFNLAQLVGGHVLDRDEVADTMLAAGLECGLSESEAIKAIRSGLVAGIAQPRVPA
jgi:hypothetical protein